ncbi:MAG: hypothetical protein H7Y38_15365 [Armatimonadetes bacterium]|nr:hypothetical protein [Armatimonadota bacterium]
MIDRRLLIFAAALLALGILALMGWTPPVLWARAQEFVNNATGAASATRNQSEKREKRDQEIGAMIDSVEGTEKKQPIRRRNP